MRNWFKKFLPSRPRPAAPAAPAATDDAVRQSAAHKREGDQLLDAGHFTDALECYRKAVDLNPAYAEALDNMGIALWELGRHAEAEHCLRQAIATRPGMANTCYNLGSLLLEQNKLDEALAAFEQAIAARPYFAEAHFQKGSILEKLGRQADAATCFLVARTQSVNQRRQLCDWRNLQADTMAVRQAIQADVLTDIDLLRPFFLISIPEISAAEQKHYAEKYAALKYHAQAERRRSPGFDFRRTQAGSTANGKLRIGYLSCDFHDHATAKLMAEVFELHDREQFHITAYSYGADDATPMRKRLERAFDAFVDIRDASDEAAAQRIHDDGTDILIDLKGYTQDNRCEILALRPAPVQVNYLGYPGTMGADFIDYLIADAFIVPPELERVYTERIIRLDDCYQPNDRTRPQPPAPPRAACGLPEDSFVFCCFNQTYKITPEIFDVWCNLLKAVPQSCLWLWMSTPEAAPNLQREAAARGVDPRRLVMAPTEPDVSRHLARLQCADLFLDTLPVNAHTTCSDALWVGLPVLTCAGETFPARVAGSLLTTLGVPELVTTSLDQYFQLARDLATNPDRLAAIRRQILANRDTSPLFDSARFTRSLERALHMMADRNRPPTL